MKQSFHYFLLLFIVISACTKPEKKIEDYKQEELPITHHSPDSISTFDSFIVKGTFPIVDTSIITAYFRTGDVWGKARAIFISDTQYTFEVPDIENYDGSSNIPFEVEFSFSFTQNGIRYIGIIETPIVYKPSFKYFGFGPRKVRKGQTITVHSSAIGKDISSLRIKFSGSEEWLPAVGYDSFTYNNGSGDYTGAGPAFRVPQNATDGFFQIKTNTLGAGTSSEPLTILEDMSPLQSGIWTQRADYATRGVNRTNLSGGGMEGAACFVIGEDVFVVGGNSCAPLDGFGSNEVWKFEPEYNSWRRVADFPGGERVFASAFTVNGKGYVGTGIDRNGQVKKDFWEYDPIINKWQRKADFPGAARYLSVGFSVNNKGYIGTGRGDNASQIFSDIYKYDPSSNIWQQVNSMPISRSEAFSFVINGNVYVGGGQSSDLTWLSDFYHFDSNNETWTNKANLPHQKTASMATFTLNGKGYAGAGRNSLNGMAYGGKEVYYYNPQNDRWQQVPDVGNDDRAYGIGFTVNNAGYIGLGSAIGKTHSYRDIWGYKE